MSRNHPEPLSESKTKLKKATKKELLDHLYNYAKATPDVIITRNHYRVHSPYAESAWSKFFGTFDEFKRQAGVTPTRHAMQLEKDVAKHAASDNYRQITKEKQGYDGKYQRNNKARFQTMLTMSDVHDVECDPFSLSVMLDMAKRVQPDKVVINGDLFDLPEFGKYSVDPREWDVVGRIKWVHGFLAKLRKAAPNTEITLIEGNHDLRLLRHLAEATPAMRAVLADLHGFTVPKLLGLDQFEVNYVAPADLATFSSGDIAKELRRNYKVFYDFFVAHHFPEARKFGLPGFNGHHHTHLVDSYFSPILGTYEWHQYGCMHKRSASYCNGERWGNGFGLVHIDTIGKKAQTEYIDTTADHVVAGGKWYYRE